MNGFGTLTQPRMFKPVRHNDDPCSLRVGDHQQEVRLTLYSGFYEATAKPFVRPP